MKLKKPPWRLWIAIMIFMTTMTNYMLRVNLSVSIVSMVEPSNETKIAACDLQKSKQTPNKAPPEPPNYGTRYLWSEAEQGIFLAAYFYGYVGTVLFGGTMSEMLGATNIITSTSLISALLTAIIPVCTQYGIGAVIALRVLIGLMGGFAYPAVNVLVAKWAPPNEKSKFMVAMMGSTMGTVVAWAVVGTTTKQTKEWAWGFYSVAIIMVAFCIIFAVITTDSPLKHRWISTKEKDYIIECQGGSVSNDKKIAPFLKILSSRYFWALCAAQFGSLWSMNLLITYAPKYMVQTQGFDLQSSSFLASLPCMASMVSCIGFGFLGDWMKSKQIMSLTKLRKIFTIFSHLLPALTLFIIKPFNCIWQATLVLLIINQGLNGAVVVGYLPNPQDLAPNFAGTICGLVNFFSSLSGFIVPSITGALLKNPGTLEGPIYIFLIGGVVTAIGGIIFIIFGTAEMQPWNTIEESPVEATT